MCVVLRVIGDKRQDLKTPLTPAVVLWRFGAALHAAGEAHRRAVGGDGAAGAVGVVAIIRIATVALG